MKLVRYAAAEVGVLIHVNERMGLHLAAGYDVYFEGSTVLMGFTPGVNLYYRL